MFKIKSQFHKCLRSDEINVGEAIKIVLIQSGSAKLISLLLTVELVTAQQSVVD